MKKLISAAFIFFTINCIKANAQIGIGTTTPKSTLDVYGSFGMKVDTITASTTLDVNYGIIICKNTSNITLTMPSVATSKGRMYFIKKASTGNITISPFTAQTIDGSANLVLSSANQMINIVADGISKWLITQNTTASSNSSATTNTLSSSGNTLTSTVNGTIATASAVNSISNTSSANTLSTTVNGITGSNVNIINTNALSSSSNALTSTVNGVSAALTPVAGTIGTSTYLGFDASGNLVKGATPTTTNTLTLSVNTLTSTVNGVAATSNAVSSVSNTSSGNNLTTTINGVAGSSVPMINSNSISISGSTITSTVNGINSSALNLAPIDSSIYKADGTLRATRTVTMGAKNLTFSSTTGNLIFSPSSTGKIGIGTTSPGSELDVKGTLRLSGSSSGYVGLAPAAAAGSTTYTLPSADGSNGYVLSTNGSGTLSWIGGGWSTTGNSSTNAGTNFIGTTDNADLVFKRNNTTAGNLGALTTSFGVSSSASVTNGTAFGASATASGSNSIALGYNAQATQGNCIAIGYGASANTNSNCMAIGYNAQANNNNYVTAIGYNVQSTSGQNTLAVGALASASADDAIAVGKSASASGQNSIALGTGLSVTSNNTVRIGNSSTTSIGGWANWSNVSDGRFKTNIKEDVKGLEFIMKLRPVTYNLKIKELNAKLKMPNGNEESIAQKEKEIQSGFIAQEVEKAANDSKYNFSGVIKPANENDTYRLSYAEFVVPMVKAMQEQQKIIDEQQLSINDLKKQLEVLKSKVQ